VDGGLNYQTVAECARAGADTFVSGTTLFGAHNLKAAVKKMRKIVNANDPALADFKSLNSAMSQIRFGTDGWRAVIAEDFTFANVARVAQATADFWKSEVQSPKSKVFGANSKSLSAMTGVFYPTGLRKSPPKFSPVIISKSSSRPSRRRQPVSFVRRQTSARPSAAW